MEYFVQCQQPDGTWEQASSTATDLDFATERLAARRRMRPEFVYRIAQRTTVVVVGPAPAAVSVPPPATRADAEAVARVRALHQPVECVNVRCKLKQWCIGCDPDGIEGCDENPWPCPTIRALDGEQPSGGPCVAGEQQNETPEAETQQQPVPGRNFAAYQAAIVRVALVLREAREHREQTDPSERQDCVMCGADHFAEIRDAIKGKQPDIGAWQDGVQP
ncbi:hypothetical protein SGFS_065400 [Streptomyces graminofaciens]|uniref:Uncharacterized protein n=1 Tax=Streptomyces graminofaciens TaxID=68212 RepID=A0ABM7FFR8_9ACTN|nr:hypothetical protein SGFS_065400 [Streptomyces graminofaciens]